MGSQAAIEKSPANDDCLECHNYENLVFSLSPLNFHDNKEKPCENCHSFHKPQQINANEMKFGVQFGNDNFRSHCAVCHNNNVVLKELSEGHKRAFSIYHTDETYFSKISTSDACQICHLSTYLEGNPSLTNSGSDEYPEPPRFNEHANHPIGIQYQANTETRSRKLKDISDSRINLIDGRIECVTCHQLGSSSDNLISNYNNPNELCQGCHLTGYQEQSIFADK